MSPTFLSQTPDARVGYFRGPPGRTGWRHGDL